MSSTQGRLQPEHLFFVSAQAKKAALCLRKQAVQGVHVLPISQDLQYWSEVQHDGVDSTHMVPVIGMLPAGH
jgi:hypothetical protein